MSEQIPPRTPPRYSGWHAAMMMVGVLLLLPGLCSLLFMIGMASEVARGDPYVGAIVDLWIVCLVISAGGVALIYAARKGARAAAANRADASAKP